MGCALKGHQMRDSLNSTRQTSHTQDSDATREEHGGATQDAVSERR